MYHIAVEVAQLLPYPAPMTGTNAFGSRRKQGLSTPALLCSEPQEYTHCVHYPVALQQHERSQRAARSHKARRSRSAQRRADARAWPCAIACRRAQQNVAGPGDVVWIVALCRAQALRPCL